MTIHDYDPASHEAQVFALWERALGDVWPLSRATFRHVTLDSPVYRPGDHLVAITREGDIAGFVATQPQGLPEGDASLTLAGELMVILVDPALQRQGIGRDLLDHALDTLRRRGVTEVQVGAGAVSYFWPGVPANLPDAWPFFGACGWPAAEESFDLVRSLDDYVTPPAVYAGIDHENVEIVSAGAADASAVLAFERRHFPDWAQYYEMVVARGATTDIVLARDSQTAEIVGTAMAMDFRPSAGQYGFTWQRLLGENVGGIGALGVAEDRRERGIGLALAAYVTEVLQARGLDTSFVGYTWLVDWYGKLGYQVWRDYCIGWVEISVGGG